MDTLSSALWGCQKETCGFLLALANSAWASRQHAANQMLCFLVLQRRMLSDPHRLLHTKLGRSLKMADGKALCSRGLWC